MKYIDKTDEEWDNIVDEWHESNSTLSLMDYMQLSQCEFFKYAIGLREGDSK